VLFFSGSLVITLLLASVGMFVALVQRITALQINNMLIFTGDHGRGVIEKMYPPIESPIAVAEPEEFQKVSVTQTLVHSWGPRAIQAVNALALFQMACISGGIFEIVSSVGETVVEGTPLLRVHGGRVKINELDLRKTVEMGAERTF
jgi:uncharacterized membrane protein